MFADEQAGGARRGGTIGTANAAGSVRLHVERLELAGSAEEEQRDDGLRSNALFGTSGLGGPDARQTETEQTGSTDLQQCPTSQSVADALRMAENGQHAEC